MEHPSKISPIPLEDLSDEELVEIDTKMIALKMDAAPTASVLVEFLALYKSKDMQFMLKSWGKNKSKVKNRWESIAAYIPEAAARKIQDLAMAFNVDLNKRNIPHWYLKDHLDEKQINILSVMEAAHINLVAYLVSLWNSSNEDTRNALVCSEIYVHMAKTFISKDDIGSCHNDVAVSIIDATKKILAKK